jgi:hypothetical protein
MRVRESERVVWRLEKGEGETNKNKRTVAEGERGQRRDKEKSGGRKCEFAARKRTAEQGGVNSYPPVGQADKYTSRRGRPSPLAWVPAVGTLLRFGRARLSVGG